MTTIDPALLARIDQYHQDHRSRLDAALTVPGIRAQLADLGDAKWCAATIGTFMEGVDNGDTDAFDLAALLSVAMTRILHLTTGDTS